MTEATPEPEDLTPEQLKELRDLGGWNQKEFGKKVIGYSRSAVDHMEAGRRTIPAALRREAVNLVEQALNNEIKARQEKIRRLRDR